jgi:AbrB family looped-hinge helix DNA binding protein
MMDMARISVKGQVTIPIAIRKMLGLKEGDKVVFAEKNGNIVLLNSNRLAFEEFQREMIGEAERIGWTSEEDVVDYCKEIRQEMWEERQHDSNA